MEVSGCDVLESHLHLVNLFPQWFFILFLKSASQIILPEVDKRLIGRKFWGSFWQSYDFCFLQRSREVTEPKAWTK
jgi:hypothetical protein